MSPEQAHDTVESPQDITEKPEDSVSRKLDAAMADLDAARGKLPVDAIGCIREHRELAVPRLIESIRTAVAITREGESPEGNAHFLALFLLTEFRATEALPVILEAVCLPGELPFDLFGDAITSVLARTLLALATDPTETLDDLLANEEINEYVRWEAAQGYVMLVRDGLIPRREAIERLSGHLRVLIDGGESPVTSYVVDALTSLSPKEAMELIEEAYERGLVDPWIVQPNEFRRSIEEGERWMQKEFKRYPPVAMDDMIAELKKWAAYSEPRPAAPNPEPPKLPAYAPPQARGAAPSLLPKRQPGRNEPCPCGSGKKYKKCCGRDS